jgi:beta-mannosidase
MAKQILNLTGKWQFRQYPTAARRMRDLDDSEWCDCTVPNSIFINLVETGKIDRGDLEANPENYYWVSDTPWVYRKAFDVPEESLAADKIELVCDGLDTIASVWLNEKLLGRTDNMFIQHRFDVTKYIKAASNQLLIRFEPAAPHAKRLMDRYTPFSEKLFLNPYRAYIRKAQYQFGWDWCPAMPGCGIWRPVRIETITKARLANVNISTIHCNESTADIRVAVTLERTARHKFHFELEIYDTDGTVVRHLKFEPHGEGSSAVVHIDNPKLWFPAGYGQPNLYQARVNLFADGQIVDTSQCHFGIRTVKLNQAADRTGRKFEFEINGCKIYAKGADWIPATLFAGSLTADDYDRLLHAAAAANINMLRVWGGGYYEDDCFYELCDRLGIMVWQDFMFACCYYPERRWFLDKIAIEARSVTERLYNHPSLVLFCGNNEIDWIHHQSGGGSGRRMHGKTIWHKLLPEIVNDLDTLRTYIPTTPFSVTEDPNDPNSGTMHNWFVWSGHQPINSYLTDPALVPRFVAEFGFQSLPCLDTVKKFCSAEHLRLASDGVEKHNYQVDGCGRLYRYVGDIFGRVCNLEQFIYLSQLTQARAIKTYVEFLRANCRRNSGVLFWQFNDCCPAISWSAVDYITKPKALYYYARRFFRPVLLAVVPDFGSDRPVLSYGPSSLSVVAVNDTERPVTGKILAQLFDLHGNILDKVDLPLAVGPFTASQPVHLPKALTNPQNPERNVLYLKLQTHETILAENLYSYLPDKYIDWPRPSITNETTQIGPDELLLTFHSDVFIRDLRINVPGATALSDNFLSLLPDTNRQIEIQFEDPTKQSDPRIEFTSVASELAD